MQQNPFIKLAKRIFWLLVIIIAAFTIMPRACSNDSVTLTASPNRKDGTAVYLLIDVSGSMNSDVPNAAGRPEQKLAIAKRAALEVCRSIDKYAQEDKSRTIQLAIASFSNDCSEILPMGPVQLDNAQRVINSLTPQSDTAIGDAVIHAQQALDKTGLKNQHIIILTDGENTAGKSPETVSTAINTLPAELRPSVYVVAFDVNASVFAAVKSKGWQVFPAANGAQLDQQLSEVVGGHILLEK